METVLIADDEINIREGLKNIIDWNELGFEVCAEAANGEEALCPVSYTHLDVYKRQTADRAAM